MKVEDFDEKSKSDIKVEINNNNNFVFDEIEDFDDDMMI